MKQPKFRRHLREVHAVLTQLWEENCARGANATGADLRPFLEDAIGAVVQCIGATQGVDPTPKTAAPIATEKVEPLSDLASRWAGR